MRLTIVTPWFPTEDSPYAGIFVRQWLASLDLPAADVTVVHLHSAAPGSSGEVESRVTDFGTLVRIPVPHEPMLSRADTARAHRDALAPLADDLLLTADVIHAHVGMPTGWAVTDLVRGQVRVLTVEHATYARTLLAHPTAAPLYREMLERTAVHLVVGEDTARTIRRRWPDLAHVSVSVGNPIDDEVFGLRDSAPSALDRWLFVGNLIERKGVMRALTAFAEHARRRPSASTSFTFVGAGPLEQDLLDLASELDVSDRVVMAGPQAPEQLVRTMHEHDVLVHLAQHETFGLTVVEAAATGLPVVVTECSGPEETLAAAARHDQAAFVTLDPEDTAQVLAAVDSLEAAEGDAAAARASVVEWYGSRAFGTCLARASAGEPFHGETDPQAPGAVVVGLTREGAREVRFAVPEIARRRRPVRFVTARVDEQRMADQRSQPLSVRAQLNRHPVFKAEAAALGVIPEAAAGAAGKVASSLAGRPGAVGRVGRSSAAFTTRSLAGWRRMRGNIEGRLISRHLRGARPVALVEGLDPAWLDRLPTTVEAVLAADAPSLEVAAELAARLGARVIDAPGIPDYLESLEGADA